MSERTPLEKPVSRRFVVALSREARRSRADVNLAERLSDLFPGQFQIVEQSYTGHSLVVVMSASVAEEARKALGSLASVEADTEIQLL